MNLSATNRLFMIMGYLACLLLVPIYVNLFTLWDYAKRTFGDDLAGLLPIIGTSLLLLIIVLVVRKRSKEIHSWGLIILGIAIACLALFTTNPKWPAKRVHVAEYMMLVLVVRYAMSFKLSGTPLLFFSFLFAAMLGVHDEMLQGFSQNRTYGIRDMLVNSLGSLAGALIWHGAGWFGNLSIIHADAQSTRDYGPVLYLFWLIASLLLAVYPLYYYRGVELIPFWPFVPLGSTIVLFTFIFSRIPHSWRHGVQAITLCALALCSYPVYSHVSHVLFY